MVSKPIAEPERWFAGLLLASAALFFSETGWSAQPLGSTNVNAALSLLETHCVRCHGGERTKAGLDLTTRESALRGGESGPAFVPGQVESSLLYQLITHQKEPGMPHKREPLPKEAVAQIAAWLAAGAPYSRALNKEVPQPGGADPEAFTISEKARRHWAFQPIKRPSLPSVTNSSWVLTPIDCFILRKVEATGLAPAERASREALIRRVTLDLIGLPPSLEEVERFTWDGSAGAWRDVVDRLLESPHYGERWGRHWLDVARFAESDGFEFDATRPHAWRYRDYVIQAFNEDKPFDQFVREQLAGDLLTPGSAAPPNGGTPVNVGPPPLAAQIATAFNLMGPDMVDSSDQVQRRHNTLNDMSDTAALAFLGLTLGCARCHDHKFEPLSQRDYYRWQAFFASASFRADLPVPSATERAAHAAALEAYNARTRVERAALEQLESGPKRKLYAEKLAKLSPEAQQAHNTPAADRTAEQQNQIQETAALLEVQPQEILKAMSEEDRVRHKALQQELAKVPKPPPLPMTMALQEQPKPAKAYVLVRGDYTQPGEEVTPGFPQVLEETAVAAGTGRFGPRGYDVASTSPGGGRRALAAWIASPENPLTARVIVNRVWQHHFGRGLVPTASDFGLRGQPPTHPELLDWLACELIEAGWSLKHLHRLILASAVYQQSSRANAEALARDPENLYFSRFNRQRLEGEVIRDSLLAISGRLDSRMGGPGVFPSIPQDVFKGAKGWTPGKKPGEDQRRSVYIFARRNLRFPFLEVFDAPDSNLSCAARNRSTSAPQSLTLLNASEVTAASAATAAFLQSQVPGEGQGLGEQPVAADEARLELLYRLALGRSPSGEERERCLAFLRQSPWTELCRAVFNLNAFVYAD